jgi:hypothetical protein
LNAIKKYGVKKLNNGCAVQGSDTTMLHAVHLQATKKRVDEDFEVKIREVTKAIK